MAVRHVLVVDDSQTELLFMSELLSKHGFTVSTARSADDAIHRVEESLPDLILMDVVMPGQNGFQLTRMLSRDERYASIPIFLCTSKNQETDRVWGMRQGARDYLTKPINASELLAKIHSLS